MGSNPGTVYWMDVSDASYYVTPKIMKIKVAEWGTPKKNILKKGLVVKILTKITAIVSQSWLDADFYIQWNPLNGITVNRFIRLMGSCFFKISKVCLEFIPKCVRLMVSFG